MYLFDFQYDGKMYKSVEHCYQELAERIRESIVRFLKIITKFGMVVEYVILSKFGYGAKKNIDFWENGGHFKKWPPPRN